MRIPKAITLEVPIPGVAQDRAVIVRTMPANHGRECLRITPKAVAVVAPIRAVDSQPLSFTRTAQPGAQGDPALNHSLKNSVLTTGSAC
jgi:hypothetical protein